MPICDYIHSSLKSLSTRERCLLGVLALLVFWALFSQNINLIYSQNLQMQYMRLDQYDNLPTILDHANIRDIACQFPILDPWDPSIIKLIKHPRTFDCKVVQPWLTVINPQGLVSFNRTELSHQITIAEAGNVTFRCQWRSVWKKIGTDRSFASSDYKTMQLDKSTLVSFEENCIQVQCLRNGTLIYDFVHAYPRNLKNRTIVASDEDNLSVLMFIIDSVSLSMFRRSLPSTYAFITKTMGATVFHGYNKHADNTFPNMIGILMNKRVENAGGNLTDELGGNYRSKFFDDFNFIWKNFSRKGYLTAYIEDKPDYSTFHYLKKGFRDKQFDWNFRPYFLARQSSKFFNRWTFCYGNKQRITQELLLSTTILEKYRDTRYFVLTFSTDLSHDDIYELERADEDMLAYFKNLHTKNLLNHTAAFVMADHGLRMTKIRNTQVGLIEERMPMFSIILPTWFYKKYPHIKESMQTNAYRLSTPLDVYSTLTDVLTGNFRGVQRPLNQRSLSQFYELPANRTCLEAEIPLHFCTCQQGTALNTTDSRVLSAANGLVNYINSVILKNVTESCVGWTLKSVERAHAMTVNEKVQAGHTKHSKDNLTESSKKKSDSEQIQLAVQVMPGDALFEALVQLSSTSGVITVKDPITRINRYGNQSACIDNYVLRPFCYCRQQSIN